MIKKQAKLLSVLLAVTLVSAGCGRKGNEPLKAEEKTITILATSDMHGKLTPWNYISDTEDASGSVFQLANAIRDHYEKETTLLVDAGDTVQDGFAEIFLSDEIHPMMNALNEMGYDVWTTGNHEYDFGMDITEHLIHEFDGHAVVSNLYGPDGNRVCEPYAIIEKDGIRIAVLCMVTPNIILWNESHMKGYAVTNPIEETERLLKELEGKYDVLLGVHHMGLKDENGIEGSGMESYLPHFPQYDAVIASHEHNLIEGTQINGILVAENASKCKSMIRIDLLMEKTEDGWKIKDKTSKAITVSDYEADEEMKEEYADADQRIRDYTSRVIGEYKGEEPLVRESEFADIPSTMMEPTGLITLINKIFQDDTGTSASCTSPCNKSVNLFPGPITVSKAAGLFPYANTLCKVRMSGRQLRKLMEWTASAFHTFQEGDLNISVDPDFPIYNFEIFSGVHYEINISKPPGERIENLTWKDGSPVRDEEEFDFLMTSYRYGSACLNYGPVFSEEDGLPVLVDSDVKSDLGGVTNMVIDYISNREGGILPFENENNWRITGYAWEEALHEEVVRLVREGVLDMEGGSRSFRKEDLPE